MQPKPPEQKIKTYRGSLGISADWRFKRDAEKLAKQGWRVGNVTATPGLRGKITVVYVR